MKKALIGGIIGGLIIGVTSAEAATYVTMPSVGGEAPPRATSSATTGTATGVTTGTSGSAGGNVEFEWKVEEGESAPPANPSGTVSAPGDGGTGVTPALMEFDTIKGESKDETKKESGEKGGTEDINIGVGESALKGGVSVAAGDVNGLTQEEKQEFMLKVSAHAEVQSEQDLENFAKGVLLEHANTEEISLNYEKIKVSHRLPAKFLGILNGSLSARAEVTADGAVSVKYPWYSFLFKKYITAENLQAALDGVIEAGNEKWLRADLSTYAEVIATIPVVIQGECEAADSACMSTE